MQEATLQKELKEVPKSTNTCPESWGWQAHKHVTESQNADNELATDAKNVLEVA